jgi:competence protein ComEC
MRSISQIPSLRIFIAFAAGILLYKFYPLSLVVGISLFLVGLCSALFFRKLPFLQKQKFTGLNSSALLILLVGLGYCISFFHDITNRPTWYKNHIMTSSSLRANIVTPLKETDRTYKAQAEIISVFNDSCKINTRGETILYFKKDSALPKISQGDEIILVNKLKQIIPKGNPGEFNFAAFCQNKGIYDQAFLTNNEWKTLPSSSTVFKNPFTHWHQFVKNTIAHYIPHPTERGIALALLTGYRDEIDKDIYSSYTKTGLVHLLAISGLHMGIFYGGTLWLLGFIPFFQRKKKLLIVLALCIMWLFALITTFPPSVQRASIMFSFLGIGQLVSRKIPSVNFLFASAFLLLLFQPHLLFEVGFQLSYAAVLGILLFFPALRKWYVPKYKIPKFFWNIVCLSLTAQIFTFPIAIYYFHQLPLLFLITNLVAIPAVMLIIYGEVMLVLCSFSEMLASLFGNIVSNLIGWLNAFIDFTATLPFVSLQDIRIHLSQCFLLLITMLCVAAWLLAHRKSFALASLFSFLLFLSVGIFTKYRNLSQEKIIVYNANQPYLEYVNGNTSFTKDTITEKNLKNFKQYISQPSHLSLGITSSKDQDKAWRREKNFDILSFKSLDILRINSTKKLKINRPISVDYLILSDKWMKNPAEILQKISTKELIIDGNIPMWKIESLKSQLQEVDLPIHYVSTMGAKIISL